MKIAKTRAELERYLKSENHKMLGFVPTMGALHEGHISLVERAIEKCGTVVVSIFVNPTQFNDPNDLKNYPRTPQADIEKLDKAGVDILFMPSTEEVYAEQDDRVFDFGELGKVMEGATRPGHFNGVAQVVTRLFEMIKPAVAYFGEKDFQQVAIVKSLAGRLDIPVKIEVCPTVRESDGLAMSSRNALLDRSHRKSAPLIYKTLREGVSKMAGMAPAEVEKYVVEKIDADPMLKVIYFEIVNGRTLQKVEKWNIDKKDGIQGCIAVQAGNVRLIDNIRFV